MHPDDPTLAAIPAQVRAALAEDVGSGDLTAALIPALAYYGCLFLTVVFQARRQGELAVWLRFEFQNLANGHDG